MYVCMRVCVRACACVALCFIMHFNNPYHCFLGDAFYKSIAYNMYAYASMLTVWHDQS